MYCTNIQYKPQISYSYSVLSGHKLLLFEHFLFYLTDCTYFAIIIIIGIVFIIIIMMVITITFMMSLFFILLTLSVIVFLILIFIVAHIKYF